MPAGKGNIPGTSSQWPSSRRQDSDAGSCRFRRPSLVALPYGRPIQLSRRLSCINTGSVFLLGGRESSSSWLTIMRITSLIRNFAFRILRRAPWPAGGDPTLFMKFNNQYAAYQIGDWTYGRPHIAWGDEGAKVKIGRFCSIGSGVTILMGSEHYYNWVSTYPFRILFERAKDMPLPSRTKGDVVIGHDVWIGLDALILSGVTIGNGAVIAARSVVTRDVAPYSIVAGVPARHVRFRFDPTTIEALQKIAWWDWPLPKIEEALPLLMAPDLKAFIERYGSGQVNGA